MADAFARLAEELRDPQPVSNAAEAVAGLAVRRVPGAEWASITLYRPPTFQTVAATDERARRADHVQYELGSGPCVDAIVDDVVYRPLDLRHDMRWPEFGRRAAGMGVGSMLSYRMMLQRSDHLVGGLNIYSTAVDAFTDESFDIGLLLTTYGALALSAAEATRQVENLRRALDTNRDIGVAVGILMTRHLLARDRALDLLLLVSQDTNRKVHDLAISVAETGDLALPPRLRKLRLDGEEPHATS
ncbi:MAG: GAF and ANTAR domain-containing protein [Actinocatenispora sp.]